MHVALPKNYCSFCCAFCHLVIYLFCVILVMAKSIEIVEGFSPHDLNLNFVFLLLSSQENERTRALHCIHWKCLFDFLKINWLCMLALQASAEAAAAAAAWRSLALQCTQVCCLNLLFLTMPPECSAYVHSKILQFLHINATLCRSKCVCVCVNAIK